MTTKVIANRIAALTGRSLAGSQIVWPGPSLVTLALVFGIWLIIYGIMEITLALRVRSAIRHVRHIVTSPA
jgi:uncharacterized membrane protein HdeD (DUF308 family)